MLGTNRWIVIGGGASGLAAAFFLKQRGIDSEVLERERTIGGRIGSVALGDRVVDVGGKNLGRRYRLFRDFSSALGSHRFEPFGLNSSQARNGTLVTFDGGRRWRSMLALGRGASLKDLARFGTLLLRVKADEESGYLGSRYFRGIGHRFDDGPVSRYFTPEFCRRIIRPMSVRMNGAEPDEIYMGNLGSNIRMVLDSYDQFAHGMAPVLNDFLRTHRVRFDARAESLLVEDNRVAGVRVAYGDGTREDLPAAGVIVAVPAPLGAPLVEPLLPSLARRLRTVAYYPVTVAVAEYDRPVFSPDLRAVVFDESEAISNAGAYGRNDLHVVRYTFSGRTARQRLASASPEELLECGETTLDRYISLRGHHRVASAVKQFQLGLCAYTPRHADFLEALRGDLRQVAGLHMTGDYVHGASIEACFRSARSCVEGIAAGGAQPATGNSR